MPEFHLSLGSNIGDRESHLDGAIARLVASGLHLARVSSVYETEPVGAAAGPGWFLNMAVSGRTDLPASDLLAICRRVEGEGGRERTVAGGPRTIDIDLLLYGEWIVSAEECEVPHPRLHERRFVLEPLAEIAAGVRHPGLDMTIGELLAGIEDTARIIRRGELGGSIACGPTRPELLANLAAEPVHAIDASPPGVEWASGAVREDEVVKTGASGEKSEAKEAADAPVAGEVAVPGGASSHKARREQGGS